MCESLIEAKTRKRELAALSEAMTALKLSEGTLVTRSEEEQIEVDAGRINIVPAWRFLLSSG